MRRLQRTICPTCKRFEEPALEICPRCVSDHRGLISIYHEILREYPSLGHLTVTEVVQRMWDDHKRKR